LLFAAASQTLLQFGANPRWVGGQIGATLILHTWGQTLTQHIHVHALVSGGGLGASGEWRPAKARFLFPVKALSRVFRGKYLAALSQAFQRGEVTFARSTATLQDPTARAALISQLRTHPWVVYAKSPMAGPAQVLEYLGRYAHRVALSNERLLALDEHGVHFRYKDYAHGSATRVMSLEPQEFIRRFLLHVLPPGLVRIRQFGFLANRVRKAKLELCRILLAVAEPLTAESGSADSNLPDAHACPVCRNGRLIVIQLLCAPAHVLLDTS
jgi:hypothetical protein